jgi:hypothetical protein
VFNSDKETNDRTNDAKEKYNAVKRINQNESGRLGCGRTIEREISGRRKNCCVVGQMLIKIYLIYLAEKLKKS